MARVPWVFEVRDLWPESAVTPGVLARTSPLTRLLYAFERGHVASLNRQRADAGFRATTLSAAVSRLIGRSRSFRTARTSTSSGPGRRDNEVRRDFGWGDRFVVLYAGAHGRANAVGQLVDAAELLR